MERSDLLSVDDLVEFLILATSIPPEFSSLTCIQLLLLCCRKDNTVKESEEKKTLNNSTHIKTRVKECFRRPNKKENAKGPRLEYFSR